MYPNHLLKSSRGSAAAAIFLALVFVGVGFLLGTCVGSYASFRDGVRATRVEAVKNGVAEWVAQPDGGTTFRWKGGAK